MDLQSLKIQRAAPAPSRRRRNPWPLRAVVLALLAATGWLLGPSAMELADRLRLPVVRTFPIREAPAAAAAAVRGTAANGYVVAARRAALSSDVPGRIVEMAVREGSVVKKGDVVARLYADEFRAALQRASAELTSAVTGVGRAEAGAKAAAAEVTQAESAKNSAAANLDEGKAQLAFTEAEYGRAEELAKTGFGSSRDLDRARNDRDGARARLSALTAAAATAATAADAARQRLAVAEVDIQVAQAQQQAATAARDLAQATLDKTDVRAPFDGIVVLKDAEVGEVVSPNVVGGSTARGAVCTMVDFDSLEVQANVPETALASVAIGAAADVFLDAFPDARYEGVVDRIWPTADRQKATVEVRVRLLKKDDKLRPEMGVRVVFRTPGEQATGEQAGGERTPAGTAAARQIVVPEAALVQIDGKTGAFVLERDVVRFVPVTTGERRGGRVVIQSGLKPDQNVVLDPPTSLQPGDRVRVAAN